MGFDATVALGAITLLTVIDSGVEAFEWDYLPLVPWGALLVAAVLDRSAGLTALDKTRAPRRALLVHAALLLPLVGALELGWIMRLKLYAKPEWQDAFETARWPICTYLASHTQTRDSIYIWGDDAGPYVACNRFPASRFVTSGAVAGFVPWIDEPPAVEDTRAIPGSREELAQELREKRPKVILNSLDTLMGRSMMQHEALRDVLLGSYCPDLAYGPTLWVRKPKYGCSAAPGAHPLVVYWSESRHDTTTVATDEDVRSAEDAGDKPIAQAGAVFDEPRPGLIPLKLFLDATNGAHLTVASADGERRAREGGYELVRIEGYIFDKPQVGTVPLTLFYEPGTHDYCTVGADSWSPDYVKLGVQGWVPAPEVLADIDVLDTTD